MSYDTNGGTGGGKARKDGQSFKIGSREEMV